jgi:hypothetical protein
MSRFRTRASLFALAGLVALLALVPLFAADTTISNFDVQNQVYKSVRLKDNNDTSFAPLVWAQPAFGGAFKVATSTGAAQANSPVLPAATGKTTYCAGFTITGGGATAASAVTCTLSDGTVTYNFMIEIPAGAGLAIVPLVVNFEIPIPATATNTAWTLTVPSFGSGNTAASANIWGYQL